MSKLCKITKKDFIRLIKENKPAYAKYNVYKKMDDTWYLVDNKTLKTNNSRIFKGLSMPSDTFGIDGDLYIYMELCIELNDYDNSTCEFLSGKHYGWKQPSMYNDGSFETGCCDILIEWFDADRNIICNGLLLKFTSDDYTESCYLSVEVYDENTMEIKYDYHNRKGTILTRIPDNVVQCPILK